MSNASQQLIPVDELPAGLQCAVRGNANPLDAIEADLRAAVYGRDHAIESVVRALNRAKFGFAAGSHDRPLVNLMFLGPTGVGKSECAKRLADRLHPDGGGFLNIDCSLFSQGHEVSALVGAPPSYVGRDQKPLLDPEMIESENSIVLFDEIEKGTPELWKQPGSIFIILASKPYSASSALNGSIALTRSSPSGPCHQPRCRKSSTG